MAEVVCVAGGMCAGETATEAGGKHPTGMRSCMASFYPPSLSAV